MHVQLTVAREVNRAYKAQMIKKLMPRIREMFMQLDENGDGTVGRGWGGDRRGASPRGFSSSEKR